MLWFVSLVVVILLVARRWKIKKFVEFSRELKCGIKSYPLIGHAHLFMGGAVNRMTTLQEFGSDAIKNGGISYIWLGSKFYAVSVDAIDLEVILKKSLEKDSIVRFIRNLIGNGISFAPVSIWRPRRKISAPTFSPANLNRFIKVFAEQSDSMVKQAKSAVGVGSVSVWKYITSYTFYSVCETALGVKLNLKENSGEEVLESYDIIFKLIAARMTQLWLHPDALYTLLPYHNTFEKNKEILYKFVNKIIRTTRQKLKVKDNGDTKSIRSFLELYIEASGGDRGYSDQELLEETLTILLAGTDTTAVGLCFTICMLADHADVQDKVFQELQEVFGDSDRQVVAADLTRLKYLEAVIRESLRLYPPVPIIVREINEDTKLPSGVTLRKGCGVVINIWSTHRNPVYWGDDADQFRPERFLEAPLKHPAAFLVFSQGPRNCLGHLYSMMSMRTVLATFLRKYRVLSKDENEERGTVNHERMKLTFDLMMKDVNGFRVRLAERTKCKAI